MALFDFDLTMLAYLDPGSGAMLLQVIAAGVAGFLVFMKYQGRRLKGFLTGRGKRDEASSRGTEVPSED